MAVVQPPPTDADIVTGLLEMEDISDDENSVKVEEESPEECP